MTGTDPATLIVATVWIVVSAAVAALLVWLGDVVRSAVRWCVLFHRAGLARLADAEQRWAREEAQAGFWSESRIWRDDVGMTSSPGAENGGTGWVRGGARPGRRPVLPGVRVAASARDAGGTAPVVVRGLDGMWRVR